jgi:glutathione S-transferase
MLILYHAPQTRSERVRWALEELQLNYQLVAVDPFSKIQPNTELLKLNPLGQVPVLVDGNQVLTESGAICLYLADRYPISGTDQFLAPPADRRADYYRWSFFVFGSLEQPILKVFMNTHLFGEQRRSDKAIREAQEQLKPRFQMLMAALNPYVCGDSFTMADVLVGSTLTWAGSIGLLENFPELQQYLDLLKQRPAYQKIQFTPRTRKPKE